MHNIHTQIHTYTLTCIHLYTHDILGSLRDGSNLVPVFIDAIQTYPSQEGRQRRRSSYFYDQISSAEGYLKKMEEDLCQFHLDTLKAKVSLSVLM